MIQLRSCCFHRCLFVCFFSDQDTDVNALLNTWLKGQPEHCRANLNNWLGDYFQQALDWIFKQVFVLHATPDLCWCCILMQNSLQINVYSLFCVKMWTHIHFLSWEIIFYLFFFILRMTLWWRRVWWGQYWMACHISTLWRKEASSLLVFLEVWEETSTLKHGRSLLKRWGSLLLLFGHLMAGKSLMEGLNWFLFYAIKINHYSNNN